MLQKFCTVSWLQAQSNSEFMYCEMWGKTHCRAFHILFMSQSLSKEPGFELPATALGRLAGWSPGLSVCARAPQHPHAGLWQPGVELLTPSAQPVAGPSACGCAPGPWSPSSHPPPPVCAGTSHPGTWTARRCTSPGTHHWKVHTPATRICA